MRGAFTAGVLQAFMDQSFTADLLVGVSAGASNGVSYVSGQHERGKRTNLDYVGDKRYLSMRSFLRTGSLFGMDFIFGRIPETLDPFDYEAFYASPCDFYAGVTDVETGKPVFFGKQSIQPGLQVMRASCSMPFFSPMVTIEGHQYLDGGVADPIPVDKALQQGCDKLLVVLTRERGYRKAAQSFRRVYRTKYRHYPNLVRAMDMRHLVYNQTLDRLAQLEAEGRAIVIAPAQSLAVDRFGQDREKLSEAYQCGIQAGLDGLTRFKAQF